MFVTTSRLACRRVLHMARGATSNVWQRHHPTSLTTSSMPAAAPRSQSLSTVLTVSPSPPSMIFSGVSGWLENLSQAIWLIKRTFQPSLIRKKRKSGYLKRRQTVGGRRILKRRKAKGRARLFGA